MTSRFQFTVSMAVLLAASFMDAQARTATKGRVVMPGGPGSTTPRVAATSITLMTASPATISFTATDPDLGAVTGSSAATVAFDLSGGGTAKTWTVGIKAGAATFTGCTTLPVSAVTATCSNVSVVNVSGTSGTGACASAVTLSTTSTTIASGREGGGKDNYTITLNFTLSDTWQNIAATSPTCPLTLTYSLTAP